MQTFKFPEFLDKAEKFQEPIYIRDAWNVTDDKIIYMYFKVVGYNEFGELMYSYIMIEPNLYYTLGNDEQPVSYFRNDKCHFFCTVRKEDFDSEFERVLEILKNY